MPGEHLVKDNAERIDIRPQIDLAGAATYLLRARPRERPDELPGKRHRPAPGRVAGLLACDLGHPEVEYVRLTVVIRQDVARFEVAVGHPAQMGRVDRREDFLEEPQNLLDREAAACDEGIDRLAGHVVHHEIVVTGRLPAVVCRDDTWCLS